MSDHSLQSFLDHVEESLAQFSPRTTQEGERRGLIESYKDGVIKIVGLSDLAMSEVVTVEGTHIRALVLNLEQDAAWALVLENSREVKEGMYVISDKTMLSIPAGEAFLGRVVNPLGLPKDGKGTIAHTQINPIEKIAPGVMARQSVNQPVQTGILAIDAMIPIGRGQRELIIGDRQTGKTTIAIDTILNQKGKDMICIYVAIGQRESKVAQVVELLRSKGAMDYTMVVAASSSEAAVLQFLAPYSGSALGEYFMEKGKDVLIIFDDLSKHAVAYREMSLLLRRPPGREAYPGDVFYLHSRLLERAAKLNKDHGGGSMTALPIIETQAGDVSAYIPTNVISITDGQIFLESELFYKGIRPAMNVGISVSRVGGSAQTKLIKKVSGMAKLSLSQYYELEAFSQFSSELDASTLAQLTRGKRVVEALKQKQNAPYALWEEATIMVAANEGYLDKIPAEEVTARLQQLLQHMKSQNTDLIELMDTKKEYSDDIKTSLLELLKTFFAS